MPKSQQTLHEYSLSDAHTQFEVMQMLPAENMQTRFLLLLD